MHNPNTEFCNLYSSVKFYVGVKITGTDGTVLLNGGTALPRVWTMRAACDAIEMQRLYAFPRLRGIYGERFTALTGREMQPSDLRVSFYPQGRELAAIYLDDVDDTTPAHFLVETSPGNWQAHFRLSRSCNEEEARAVIRALRDWYGGDAGAAKARQGRRFITDGLGYEAYWAEEDVDVDEAVRLYWESEPIELYDDEHVELSETEKTLFRSIWNRKLATTRNKSKADFGLAAYLLERGRGAAVAREAIRCARITLAEDKGAHTEKYLKLTVRKAVAKIHAHSSCSYYAIYFPI
jgi:hypothetical protein